MQIVNTKKIFADLYISLIIAMFAGRVLAGLSMALIFSSGNYSMAAWITVFFVNSFPGMLIQLAFLPSLVIALETSGLIPRKY